MDPLQKAKNRSLVAADVKSDDWNILHTDWRNPQALTQNGATSYEFYQDTTKNTNTWCEQNCIKIVLDTNINEGHEDKHTW